MGRQFWGLALVVVGALTLVQTLGYSIGLSVWPVVLTLVGLSFLAGAIRRFSWMKVALGLWIGSIGLFDILFESHVTTINGTMIMRSGWPIVLVAVGLSMLFGRQWWWGGWDWRDGNWRQWRGPQRVRVGRMVGGVGPQHWGGSSWRLDQDLHIKHGMGDVKVDLTTAEITDGVHEITVDAGVGDVRIRVPENVNVTVDAATNVGQLVVLGERRDGLGLTIRKQVVVPDSPIELKIEARLGVGDLRVVSGPAAPKVVE